MKSACQCTFSQKTVFTTPENRHFQQVLMGKYDIVRTVADDEANFAALSAKVVRGEVLPGNQQKIKRNFSIRF
jgi:hypothetical protein